MSRRLRSWAAGRCGALPPGFAAALLAAPAVLLMLVPSLVERLQYDRAAIASGQLWRLVTGHWTHWSVEHLVWDLLAFVVSAAIAFHVAPRRALFAVASSSLLITGGLWFAIPGMTHYRGLSGIDSTLFVFLAVFLLQRELRSGRRGMAAALALALAAFAAKVGFELVTASTLFVESTGFVPVPLAHLIGGVCGGFAAGRRAVDDARWGRVVGCRS